MSLSKETLILCLNLISQISISASMEDDKFEETFQSVLKAKRELNSELHKLEVVELVKEEENGKLPVS